MPLIAYLIMALSAERLFAVGAVVLTLTRGILGIRVAGIEQLLGSPLVNAGRTQRPVHAPMRHVLVLGVADVGWLWLGHWYSLPY